MANKVFSMETPYKGCWQDPLQSADWSTESSVYFSSRRAAFTKTEPVYFFFLCDKQPYAADKEQGEMLDLLQRFLSRCYKFTLRFIRRIHSVACVWCHANYVSDMVRLSLPPGNGTAASGQRVMSLLFPSIMLGANKDNVVHSTFRFP